MNSYFCSDWHLDHKNILKYERGMFSCVQEMNQRIIDDTNAVVGEEDVIYLGGDVLFAGYLGRHNDKRVKRYYRNKYDLERYLEVLGNFRGQIKCKRIHLILGNHDEAIEQILDDDALENFQFALRRIFVDINYLRDFYVGNQRIFFCHYLALNALRRNNWVLYAHSHSKLDHRRFNIDNGRYLDVGVDNHYKMFGNYGPFSIPEINGIMIKKNGIVID